MSKVKIRFLKDHDFFDEEPKSFNMGEVISIEETSANHYLKRGLAEIAPANTTLCKPERQVELPLDDQPVLDEKVVGLREKVSTWLNGLLPDTKPEDAESALAEILPNAEEAAKVIIGKANEDAKGITDKAEEDATKILQEAGKDGDDIINRSKESAKDILNLANEEAKKIKDKK